LPCAPRFRHEANQPETREETHMDDSKSHTDNSTPQDDDSTILELRSIPLSKIVVDNTKPFPHYPKRLFHAAIALLARNSAPYVPYSPLLVQALPTGTFRLLGGRARFRALSSCVSQDVAARLKVLALVIRTGANECR
jgi:hypothetical protein